MLEILICHQAREEREELKKILENIILIENFQMEITVISGDPREILRKVKENTSPAVYFLGVSFDSDMNGISLGSKIREYDELGVIVFVTPHIEMSYLAYLYKVEALDYIILDKLSDIKDRLEECLVRANRKLILDKSDSRNFKIRLGDRVLSLSKDEIIYFETATSPHKLVLHTEDENIEFMGRLKHIENGLGKGFFRCHKSYLINTSKVRELDIKEKVVTMSNGEKCLVSKRALNELVQNI